MVLVDHLPMERRTRDAARWHMVMVVLAVLLVVVLEVLVVLVLVVLVVVDHLPMERRARDAARWDRTTKALGKGLAPQLPAGCSQAGLLVLSD